jgi:hypothetical protein
MAFEGGLRWVCAGLRAPHGQTIKLRGNFVSVLWTRVVRVEGQCEGIVFCYTCFQHFALPLRQFRESHA